MTETPRTIKDITLQNLMNIFLDPDAHGVHFQRLSLPLTQTDKIGAALVGAFFATQEGANDYTIEALLDILDAARFWCTVYTRIAHSQAENAPALEPEEAAHKSPPSEDERVSNAEEA